MSSTTCSSSVVVQKIVYTRKPAKAGIVKKDIEEKNPFSLSIHFQKSGIN